MTFIPFARKFSDSPLSHYSGERALNYYVRQADAVSPAVLIGRSGLASRFDLGGPVRAMGLHNEALFAVADGRLWDLSGATAVAVGRVGDSVNTSMASNGTQIAVVADDSYSLYDGTSTAEYATGSVVVPRGVIFIDQFFLVFGETEVRRDAFTISGINDGKTFAGLDLTIAEALPDRIVGVIRDHTEVWVLGSQSTEVFFNTGDADQPFQRNPGAFMERGCIDQRTISKEDNATFWVGEDNFVYRSGGGVPEVISTREVEETLSASVITGGFVFTDRGHKFYAISRAGATTLMYDMTTRLWCEASTGVGDGPWIGTHAVTASGVIYIGTSTGKVCTFTQDSYTDDGDVIVARATSAPLVQGGNPFTIGKIHLSADTGAGDAGREARVILQMSKDGKTWGREKPRSLGRLGNREKLIRWHGLGRFRRVQARFTITDPVQRDLHGISL